MIITVAEGGLLSLTQQMDSFHQLGSPVESHPTSMDTSVNPFASRTNRVKSEDNTQPNPFHDISWPPRSSNNWSPTDNPQGTEENTSSSTATPMRE